MASKREDIGTKRRFNVLSRDRFTCQYCGRKPPEVVLNCDHIHPVSKGGGNEMENLITSCEACNLGKGATRLDGESKIAIQIRRLHAIEELKLKAEVSFALSREMRLALVDQAKYICDIVSERPEFSFFYEHFPARTLPYLLTVFTGKQIVFAIESLFNALPNVGYVGVTADDYFCEIVNHLPFDNSISRRERAVSVAVIAGLMLITTRIPPFSPATFQEDVFKRYLEGRSFRSIMKAAIFHDRYCDDFLSAVSSLPIRDRSY